MVVQTGTDKSLMAGAQGCPAHSTKTRRLLSTSVVIALAALLLGACGGQAAKAARAHPHHGAHALAGPASSATTSGAPGTSAQSATTGLGLATTTTIPAAATTTAVPESVGYGYLATGASEIVFLQFTKEAGGQLTGTVYDDTLSGSPPDESVQNSTESLTGTVDGGQLTVTFTGASAPVFGRFSANTVRLEVPQSDGSLAQEVFIRATPAQYDSALASLQQKARADNQAVFAPTDPAALCRRDCPSLPAVPSGFYSVGVFAPSKPSGMVNFSQRPLEVCFALSGPVGSLAYEIGSPYDGPTTLYQTGSAPSGCVSDPGNDSGVTKVAITASGSGMWLVQIDEATQAEVPVLQQQAAADQSVDQAAQAVSSDESNIPSDASTLTSDEESLAGDVSTVKQDLQTVQSDLAQVQSDLKSDPTSTCGDASTVAGDESSLEGDQSSYEGDLSSDQSDVSTLQQDASTLQSDWRGLMAAEASAPSYVPSGGLPTKSAEASALATASAALSQYQKAVSTDTATIASYVAQAKAYVVQANQLCSRSNG